MSALLIVFHCIFTSFSKLVLEIHFLKEQCWEQIVSLRNIFSMIQNLRQLIITSSVTKDVYIHTPLHLANQTPKANIYVLGLVYLLLTLVVGNTKDSIFWNNKFPGFGNPYNLFKYFQNKDIDSNKTLWINATIQRVYQRTTVSERRKQ